MNQSQVIKLIEIKEFLRENLIESKTVMIRIFNINVKTLTAFIDREKKERDEKKHEKHKKILKSHHENAIHDYIQSLLNYDFQFIDDLIYSFIASLKKLYNCSSSKE
jgi:valyl-tRNA synthetase